MVYHGRAKSLDKETKTRYNHPLEKAFHIPIVGTHYKKVRSHSMAWSVGVGEPGDVGITR